MRQVAPISLAIHLGAEKIIVIGAGCLLKLAMDLAEHAHYPSLVQIAGLALSSIFIYGIASLPRHVRRLPGDIGATEARGVALASYLLFEHSYTGS